MPPPNSFVDVVGCVNSTSKKKERRLSGAGPHGDTSHISRDALQLASIDPDVEERDSNLTGAIRTETLDYGKFLIDYAYLSQRGYYPDAPNKANQDSFSVIPNLFGESQKGLFAVFDGHGKDGDLCSIYVKNQLPVNLEKYVKGKEDSEEIQRGLTRAFTVTNNELHKAPKVDDSLSGTTAIAVLLDGEDMYIANVGDSRAVLASEEGGKLVAKALSNDQTPYRKDERDRVKACGARVMSMDQIEGFEPLHENWGQLKLGEEIDEGGDPPRVWSQYGEYPGTAFTRSLGDAIAEELGVSAEPEIEVRKVAQGDKYIIVASDGVFEFITNQAVVDMVDKFQDPLEACRKVIQEAYDLWLQYEVRTDDITMVVLKLRAPEQPGAGGGLSTRGVGGGGGGGGESGGSAAGARPARRGYSREKKKALIAAARAQEEAVVDLEPYYSKKSRAEKARILEAIKSCFLFENLSKAQAETICKVMECVPVRAGDVLIRQGDEGDRFYVIDHGRFEVRIAAGAAELAAGDLGPVVHTYDSDGSTHPSFGELALMYSKPRGASVVALGDGQLWALARPVFKHILTQQSSKKDLLHTLRRVDVLRSLTLNQLDALASVAQDVHFSRGQAVIRQGDLGDCMYVIQDGKCDVQIQDGGGGNPTPKSSSGRGGKGAAMKTVAQLGQYGYFGEKALLSDEPRTASVVAAAPTTLLRIDKAAFESVLGPLQHIIEEHARRRERADRKQPEEVAQPFYMLQRFGILCEDPIGVLQVCSFSAGSPTNNAASSENRPTGGGGGSFGAGFMRQMSMTSGSIGEGRHKRRTYTLRTMWKKEVAEQRLTGNVLRGVELARELRHSASAAADGQAQACVTVPQLVQTYKDTNFLHALFDVTVACDVQTLLEEEESLSCEAVLHSAACVVLGLAYVHGIGLKYRGVSPDLLYLDHKGYTVLMEYRFAKAGLGPSATVCGAPEYLPPELVAGRGSGVAQDFWALGCYLHDLSLGRTPCAADREVDLFANITNFRTSHLKFPEDMPAALQSLIEGLLSPDPQRRLGCTGNGLAAIKSHHAFAGVAWEPLASGTQTSAELLRAAQAKLQAAINKNDSVSSVDKIFMGDDELFKDF